jgi:hypothetical protein
MTGEVSGNAKLTILRCIDFPRPGFSNTFFPKVWDIPRVLVGDWKWLLKRGVMPELRNDDVSNSGKRGVDVRDARRWEICCTNDVRIGGSVEWPNTSV